MSSKRLLQSFSASISLLALIGLIQNPTQAQNEKISLYQADVVPNPTVSISVDRPILVFQTVATTTVNLLASPLNFTPTSYKWKQLQEYLSPNATTGTVTFLNAFSAATPATFSAPGVYEIELTATDGGNTVVRHTWVNVWSTIPALKDATGKLDALTAIPGILPPPSVRTLSPDPGAFNHPRVFCTNQDWDEISTRDTNAIIASTAVSKMQSQISDTTGIYTSTSALGILFRALLTYANNNYTGTVPDLTLGNTSTAASNMTEFETQLKYACYLAWIRQDPTVPHSQVSSAKQTQFNQLATVVSAYCRVLFARCWNRSTNTFTTTDPLFVSEMDKFGWTPGSGAGGVGSQIGLAYDYIAPWMITSQQQDTRDFLFATSWGRTTGSRYPGGNPHQGGLDRGDNQNGDFANLSEYLVFNQMAIAGEESGVSSDVYTAFTNFEAGSYYTNGYNVFQTFIRAGDWARPYDSTSSWQSKYYACQGTHPDFTAAGVVAPAEVDPYPDAMAWPNALKVDVDNLWRQILWTDYNVSPWGFSVNREAYLGLSAFYYWPAAVSYAIHGGENQFVTGNFYNSMLLLLHESHPGERTITSSTVSSLKTNIYLYDHEDSDAYDYRLEHILLLKYMYPDDPAVDYLYAANAPLFPYDCFQTAIFGLDPGINGQKTTLPQVAISKRLPLIKLDPQSGVAVTRNGWQEGDATFYFASSWMDSGHLHAEKNNFSFFALGRAWAIAPGYHITINDAQSSVLIQEPSLASNAPTAGFIGQSPSSAAFDNPSIVTPGRPVSGHLLQVTEDSRHNYTLISGDATDAYGYGYGGVSSYTLSPWSSYMYPGLFTNLVSRHAYLNTKYSAKIKASSMFRPVKYALRSALFVRGARPYVLVVDDFNKDDTARNYKWCMNCSAGFGTRDAFINSTGGRAFASLAVDTTKTATPTDITVYHSPIDDVKIAGQTGLARLLVRDVSEINNSSQPTIKLEVKNSSITTAANMLTYGIDNNAPGNGRTIVPTSRVLIERDNVVKPQYKVLLFPYRTGELLPTTTWNAAKTRLTIDLQNGYVDTITFTSNADNRTRISFSRATKGVAGGAHPQRRTSGRWTRPSHSA